MKCSYAEAGELAVLPAHYEFYANHFIRRTLHIRHREPALIIYGGSLPKEGSAVLVQIP